MKVVVQYLVPRKGWLYFRRRVPDKLREAIGQREWHWSLGLREDQELEAAAKVKRLTRQTQKLIDDAKRGLAAGRSQAELAAEAGEWLREAGFHEGGEGRRPLDRERGVTPADLWTEQLVQRVERRTGLDSEDIDPEEDFTPEEYMRWRAVQEGRAPEVPITLRDAASNYAKRHKAGSMSKAEETAVAQLQEFLGHDVALADISRGRVQDWFNHLVDVRGQKASTVQRRKNSMRAVIERAIEDFDLDIKNPFTRARVPAGGGGSGKDCLPFHTEHLKLIDAHLESSKRLGVDVKVMLRLLKATGCRPAEISGLDWADVVLDHEVPHLMIRPNAHRGLKNAPSERDIPLSAAALEALQLLPESPRRGAVFPGADINGVSKRQADAIRAAGVPKSRRLVPRSYRHTFAEAMRVARVEPGVQRYLRGHGEAETGDRYGSPRPEWADLKKAVEAAADRLGEVGREIYEEHEWPAEAA